MNPADTIADLFTGPAGEHLLESQLAMLDAYEKWLDAGSFDTADLNEVIKSALGAHLALLKSTGEVSDHLRGLQREWVRAYRAMLNEQLRAKRKQAAPDPNG